MKENKLNAKEFFAKEQKDVMPVLAYQTPEGEIKLIFENWQIAAYFYGLLGVVYIKAVDALFYQWVKEHKLGEQIHHHCTEPDCDATEGTIMGTVLQITAEDWATFLAHVVSILSAFGNVMGILKEPKQFKQVRIANKEEKEDFIREVLQ